LSLGAWTPAAHALTPKKAHALAAGDNDRAHPALKKLSTADDPALTPFLKAMLIDAVKVTADRAYIVQDDGQAVDAVTGQPAALPDDAEDVVNNNRMRSEIEAALAALPIWPRPTATCAPRPSKRCCQRRRRVTLPVIDQAAGH
jgi:urea transport system permease protein